MIFFDFASENCLSISPKAAQLLAKAFPGPYRYLLESSDKGIFLRARLSFLLYGSSCDCTVIHTTVRWRSSLIILPAKKNTPPALFIKPAGLN